MNEIIGVVIAVIGGIIHSRLQKNRLAVEIHMQWWIPLWTDILLPIVRWILYFLSLSERQFSANIPAGSAVDAPVAQ